MGFQNALCVTLQMDLKHFVTGLYGCFKDFKIEVYFKKESRQKRLL